MGRSPDRAHAGSTGSGSYLNSGSAPSDDYTGNWLSPHFGCARSATLYDAAVRATGSRLAGGPVSGAAGSGKNPLTGVRWLKQLIAAHRRLARSSERVAGCSCRPWHPAAPRRAVVVLSRLRARLGALAEVRAAPARVPGGLHSTQLLQRHCKHLASDWPSGRRVLWVTIGGRWSRRGKGRGWWVGAGGEGPQL